MSESDEGVRVAVTRQNATELVKGCCADAVPFADREKPFGGTNAARVTVMFCAFSDWMLSHVSGAVAVALVPRRAAPRIATTVIACVIERTRLWRLLGCHSSFLRASNRMTPSLTPN